MLLPIALLLQAAAGGSPEAADARCAAVFSYVAANQPANAATAKAGVLYFTGKLYGRHPGLDLTATLRKAGDAIGRAPLAELPRCRNEAQAAVRSLATAGQAIARGK